MEVRQATNKILEMIDEQLLDPKAVVMMCLKWMSEDSAAEMAEANELFEIEEEEEEEEDYGDVSNPYVIFAGETADDLYPVDTAFTKEEAISKAADLWQKTKKCVEATYMPEDDIDTNVVVWSNCRRN